MKILFLLLLTLMVTPNARAGSLDDASAMQLTRGIEAKLAAAQKTAQLEPWLDSKTHFMLARGYAFLGDEAKRDAHMSAIAHIRDRRILIRPYLDSLYAAVRNGKEEEVFLQIENAGLAAAAINKIAYVEDLHDPEFETTVGEAVPEKWLSSNQCEAAAYLWSARMNVKAIERLKKMSGCQEKLYVMIKLQLALLARSKNLQGIYDVIHSSYNPPFFAASAATCVKEPEAFEAQSRALIARKAANSETTFILLVALQQYDAALSILAKNDKFLGKKELRDTVLDLYSGLFLVGKNSEAISLAGKLGLFKEAQQSKATHWAQDMSQWWVHSIDAAKVLSKRPGKDAYEIALKIENAHARFKALQDITLALKGGERNIFPDCAGDAGLCAMTEMARIAKEEKADYHRDMMYGILSGLAEIVEREQHESDFFQGLEQEWQRLLKQTRQQLYFNKIIDPRRQTCSYDMCGPGVITKLRRSSASDADQRATGLWNFGMNDFSTSETKAPTLFDALREFKTEMDRHWDFKLVSSQSGYAASPFESEYSGANLCVLDAQERFEKQNR
ncbi:MAG: hypothetical protein PSY14_10765 [bacterium]|nr:hypothetical protein [bacterium]